MKKYAFLVYHKEHEAFLKTLRDAGVVHIKETKSIAGNAELGELQALRKRVSEQIAFLTKLKDEAPRKKTAMVKSLSKEEYLSLLEKVEELQEKKSQLAIERQAVRKDLEYMRVWGNFSYSTIENLKESGYVVSFFTCPTSKFDTRWEEEYNAFTVNNHQSTSYFITITKVGEQVEIEADRPKMPDRGLDVLETACEQLDENIRTVDRRLIEMAAYTQATFELFDKQLQDEFNFAKAIVQTDRQAEDKLLLLEGWTTENQASGLEKRLDADGYFYQEQQIDEGENVPIQLKNNRYARLFEPITKMFSLPNYTELDPTPLLAPFFMLFFGLCFGDAGYGLLVLIAATVLKGRVDVAMKPILSLAQWLGGTTIVVGTLTGTLFGVALVDVAEFRAVKDYFLSQDNLMTLAIILGLIHIVFGKIVAACKTKKQKGLKYSIAPWAWVLVITALLLVFGLPMLDIQLPQTIIYVCYSIAAVCGLAILLYNSPGKNIFLNIGSAVWGTYNLASGMLGDTLSYIRLFAIGLTGGILGSVFNMLGVDMTAGLPIVVRIPVMLIILLIGHGLNIGLCTISSLVHPVRLVFVEYFKNSEYEGGGIAYLPFKKT
jgi:V/A-type H+-transporting ATPase subunit I